MIETIRRNTFETNSSSCHSVTYVNDVDNPIFDFWETISVKGDGEYGWSGRASTPEEKLDYYIVHESYKYETKEDFEEFLSELKLAFEREGCTLEIEPAYSDGGWHLLEGYIDHESLGCLKFESYKDVFDWVFTNGTGVICLNDNQSYDYNDESFFDLHY